MYLKENDCRNRGYVLCGFPRTYKDAQNIFLKRIPKYNEDGELIEEDEPELEEGEEKSWEGYEIDQSISPDSIILLKAEDEFLINRIKNLPEKEIENTHYTEQDMKRRLKQYRIANNSTVGEPSICDFFAQNNIKIHE